MSKSVRAAARYAYLLGSAALLWACGPVLAPATDLATVASATASVINGEAQASATPTQRSPREPAAPVIPPPLLQTDYDNTVRVIPALLDPETQFDQVVAQYRELTREPQPAGWFGGTVTGGFNFQIGLALPPGASGRVQLRYPIRVTISLTEAAAGAMNVITPLHAGGGGVFNTFPEFPLKPGQIEVTPSDISAEGLEAGAVTEVGYDFYATCREPGVYRADFLFPYEARIGSQVQSQGVPFGLVLACPLEVRVWVFDPETGALAGTTRMDLDGGVYVPQP